MPVTLRDIADRVGKSVATVSRALGGYDDISPATRADVLRVAAELGYEPNVTARNLQQRRTDSLGIILSPELDLRLSDPFFSEFLAGVVDHTSALGFGLSIATDAHRGEREAYLRQIRGRRVDGLIVNRTRLEDERVALLLEHDVPFVTFGRTRSPEAHVFVDEDGHRSMRLLVDHLAGLGHRRLAFLAEPLGLSKAHNRLRGFLDGHRAHGLPIEPSLVVEAGYRQDTGRRAAEGLLRRPDRPTAIVACNDLLAIGAMEAAEAAGLRVGHDVSIAGFDDILLARLVRPGLTTMHVPATELGGLVADRLVGLIRGEAVPAATLIEPELVVRDSTGPAPGSFDHKGGDHSEP